MPKRPERRNDTLLALDVAIGVMDIAVGVSDASLAGPIVSDVCALLAVIKVGFFLPHVGRLLDNVYRTP